jgi:hypothetical protein
VKLEFIIPRSRNERQDLIDMCFTELQLNCCYVSASGMLMANRFINNKMCYETQMPCTRQIPEVAIIIKTQGQDLKIYGFNIKVLS